MMTLSSMSQVDIYLCVIADAIAVGRSEWQTTRKSRAKKKNDLNFGNILLFENRMVGPCASVCQGEEWGGHKGIAEGHSLL